MVDKVIRDGKVAVLTSPRFGSGWSTWADEDQKLTALFDRRFVEAAENGVRDINALCEEVFGDEYFYTGGWNSICVNWLDQGTQFTVEEYDGSESIRLVEDLTLTA